MTSLLPVSEFEDYIHYSKSMNLSFTEFKPEPTIPARSPARLQAKAKAKASPNIEDSPSSNTDMSLFEDNVTTYSDKLSIFSDQNMQEQPPILDEDGLCLDGIDVDELLDEISLTEDSETVVEVQGVVAIVAIHLGISEPQLPKLIDIPDCSS